MLARLHSVTLDGIEGVLCEVEVDIARRGFEKPIIVGLPDAAVKESSERVRSRRTSKRPDRRSIFPLRWAFSLEKVFSRVRRSRIM